MGKYKEVREVIVNSLSDKQWHGVDEIQSKCEEEGINLEGNRGPIYNVVHQLKKKGKIEANGIGEYRICKQSVEPVKKGRMEFSNKQKNQLEVSIGNIEMYVDKYKKFDWINCSDEELQDARSNVTRLLRSAVFIIPIIYTFAGTEKFSSEYSNCSSIPRLSFSISINNSPNILLKLPRLISSIIKK